MPVAAELQPFLDAMAARDEAPPAGMDQVRAFFEAMCQQWIPAPPALASVHDTSFPGPAGDIGLRVYRPLGDGPRPVLVFFHGGGFFVGSLDSHDPVCRALAARAGWVVVSVDYRLAPEHPFPAATDDCIAALSWVADHAAELGGDPARLAVAGDSAGGNLAAVTALRARDQGGPELCLQVLVYPVTEAMGDHPSMTDNASGYFLTADAMRMSWAMYTPDEATRDDPYAAPLRAGHLDGLPPALVVTAEFDPLRDEGEAYADRLAADGVAVHKLRCDGMIHGFVQMLTLTPRAGEVLDVIAGELGDAAR